MVASTVTILPIYLDCREKFVLSGGATTFDDDSIVHKSDSRTVSSNERSDRVQQSWQLSWSPTDADFIVDLFQVCRMSKGFLFISPLAVESASTGQLLRNTATGLNLGDGSTTTFQLQHRVSVANSIGGGYSTSNPVDVNYPLQGTVIGYKNGVAATLSNVNLLTGVVTFATAPGNGVIPTADYERAKAVRFTSGVSRSLLEATHTEVRSAQIEEIL